MEKKKFWKLSTAALIVSLIPLATLVPTLFPVTLTEEACFIWSGVNVFSALFGLILSAVCVINRDSRSIINIFSTLISIFWILLMCGIVALAVFLNFLKAY